jgi:hypothetical protein
MIIQLLLSSTLICTLPSDPYPSDLTAYLTCHKVETQLRTVAIWRPLIDVYFEEEDVNKALMIIYCESKGKPTAVGINKDGTKDVGLWQFNDNTWAWLKGKLGFTSSRTNPVLSTKVAKWLIYNDGWYHWNSSKHCWGIIEKIKEA